MTKHCETCQCEHRGTLPKFTLLYLDGRVVHGGGPLDDISVYSFSRAFVEAPFDGLVIGCSEAEVVGRRPHRGMEMIYYLPTSCEGGPDVVSTGPETHLLPFMARGGFAKMGTHVKDTTWYDFQRKLATDNHVPQLSARLPFELEQRDPRAQEK